MVKAGSIEAVLVDRVGDHRRGAPIAHVADGGLDRAEDRGRIAGVWAARLGTNGHVDRYDRKCVPKDQRRALGRVDRPDRYRPVEPPSQRREPIGIVDQIEGGKVVAKVEPSLEGDITADAGGLAHRQGEWQRRAHTLTSTKAVRRRSRMSRRAKVSRRWRSGVSAI